MQHDEAAGAVLRIDLDALVSNYRTIQREAAPAAVAAVIKADGYGLGAATVLNTLRSAGCRTFFVAQLGEAIALEPRRHQGIALFILNGLQPGAEDCCAAAGAIPVLNSLHQIDRWAGTARKLGRILPAALQIDSGMSRFGLEPADVAILAADRTRLDGIQLQLVMSHLACADDPEAAANTEQLRNFETLARHFPGTPKSLDNSAGSFLGRDHFDLVRAGIALYGGAPHAGRNPMRAVVSLEARIAQLRTVSAGAGVGYGLTHRFDRPARLATIPVGYADGWPRQLSNRGSAFIGGIRVPIVGRVSMDSITFDVTHVPDALLYPGAPVELLGEHQTIDDVATDAGTISYEILTQLGHRYHREYREVRDMARNRSAAL